MLQARGLGAISARMGPPPRPLLLPDPEPLERQGFEHPLMRPLLLPDLEPLERQRLEQPPIRPQLLPLRLVQVRQREQIPMRSPLQARWRAWD